MLLRKEKCDSQKNYESHKRGEATFFIYKIESWEGLNQGAGSKSYLFCAALLQCAIGQQRT